MTCRSCGADASADAFCAACGAAQEPVANHRIPAEIRKRSNAFLWGGVACLASIVVGLWTGDVLLSILLGSLTSVAGLYLLFYGWGLRHGAVWAYRWTPAVAKGRADTAAFFWHDELCPGCGRATLDAVAFCGSCGHPLRAPPMKYASAVALSFRRLVVRTAVEPARTVAFRRRTVKETSDTFLVLALVTMIGGWIAVNQFSSFASLIVVIGVTVPPFLLLLWLRKQDRFEAEPLTFMMIAFGWGILSGIVVIPLNSLVGFAPFAGVTEEIAKAAILVFFAAHPIIRKEMNGPTDGLVYGAAAGLGFAAMENFGYVLQIAQGASLVDGFLLRSANVLGHMMYTGLTGAFLGLVLLRTGNIAPRDLLSAFWPACAIHAANNSAGYFPGVFSYVFFAAAFGVGAWWFFKAFGDALRDEAAWGFHAGHAPVEVRPSAEFPPG